MEKKYTNIKERVLFYAKYQGVGIECFLKSIGMTYGSFKGKAKKGTLNSDAIVEIYTLYPNINLEWLLTGKGEMIETKSIKNIKTNDRDQYLIELQKKRIETLEEAIEALKKGLEFPYCYRTVA